MKKYNVAILGATGAVGTEFLKLIEERSFPFAELRLLASKRSAGKQIEFMGKTYTVQLLLITPAPSVWTPKCRWLCRRLTPRIS